MSNSGLTRTEKILKIIDLLFVHPTGVKINSLIGSHDFTSENAGDLFKILANKLPNHVEIEGKGESTTLRFKNKPLNYSLDAYARQAWQETPALLAKIALELNDGIVDEATLKFVDAFIASPKDQIGKDATLPSIVKAARAYVDYRPFQETFKTFFAAISKKKFCEVLYAKPDMEKPATLYFAPLEIVGYHGKIYVEGRRVKSLTEPFVDYGQRSLALQRVKKVTITNTDIRGLETPSRENQEPLFGLIRTNPFTLNVNFAPYLASYLEEHTIPGLIEKHVLKGRKTGKKKSPFKGWIKLKIRCGDPYEPLTWLLGFGSGAVIISPKTLKELYRDELIVMARRNGGLRCTKIKSPKQTSSKKASAKDLKGDDPSSSKDQSPLTD
ncbi:MAG: WYL domain-containing protein [Deltaproteobacteria bacterium]|jgi:hypothetical protein|nr:WYL domain-containing protein [Deltaproteobacteria bacterium]